MKTTITFNLDVEPHTLERYGDEYIAQLWAIAQANPAPRGDHDAAQLVGILEDEIVRRWLDRAGHTRYGRQSDENYYHILTKHGHWRRVEPAEQPEPADFVCHDGERRRWVPEKAPL